MSRILWVRFLCFEGVHHEVASERPLLAAPQSYLCGQDARARLVRKDTYHPSPPLHLFEEPLEHVRRAYPGMVASRVAKVGECVLYPALEDRDGLGVALLVEIYELLGQSPRTLLLRLTLKRAFRSSATSAIEVALARARARCAQNELCTFATGHRAELA